MCQFFKDTNSRESQLFLFNNDPWLNSSKCVHMNGNIANRSIIFNIVGVNLYMNIHGFIGNERL